MKARLEQHEIHDQSDSDDSLEIDLQFNQEATTYL